MSEQIYKDILNFKLREPNLYGLRLQLSFRYRTNNWLGLTSKELKPPTIFLYLYICEHLHTYHARHDESVDSLIARCCTVNIHPDKVGIKRQHLGLYVSELESLNFIMKSGTRGYDYVVNPYYCNVLTKEMAKHVQLQVAELLRALPPQTSLFQ